MANREAFDAAVQTLKLFNAYVHAVGQEIGPERAKALVTKTFESVAVQQARLMKERADVAEFDAQTAFSALSNVPKTLGIRMNVVEQGPGTVVAKSSDCPIYEAAKAVGMDHSMIEGLCRSGPAKFMAAAAQQLNPALDYRLTFRSTPDGCCEEQMVMT
jgi:hypothetical protein